ncbi:MAG TPA: EthD family reductase [Myxococcota bacterium]|nr:EthD family reductase [Myxococcota bacterium]
MIKLIGLLANRSTEPVLAVPYLVCRADETDAVIAAVNGTPARAQPHAGLVLAWPPTGAECEATEAALAPYVSALYRTREVLHWDELGAPTADAIVLAYLVRRRADLSSAAFEAHYRERHAPLARVHHPGIARYVQNYLARGDATRSIDAISELWFRSERDARTRFYRDEESVRAIGEDVRRFIDLRGGSAFAARPRPA